MPPQSRWATVGTFFVRTHREAAGICMVDHVSRVRPLSNGDLERLKEVAVAARDGVVKSADRRGYSRLIDARYVTARPVGTSAFFVHDNRSWPTSTWRCNDLKGSGCAAPEAPRSRACRRRLCWQWGGKVVRGRPPISTRVLHCDLATAGPPKPTDRRVIPV